MFGKKCPRCNSKVGRKDVFCHDCGLKIQNNKQKDYGLLGEKDIIEEELRPLFNSNMLGGISAPMLNKMLSGAMKMLEKEMGGLNKEQTSIDSNFQLFINGKRVNPSKSFPLKEKEARNLLPSPSEKVISTSKDLPRKEAKYKLKRTDNKITYEIELPGIQSLDNLLITQLEDSVEVKAYTKKQVLYKTLPVKLPIKGYFLENQTLFLEFQGN